jgi:serine/threonine-protein kinase
VIELGDILAHKYRIERLLGKGGMGYVFLALHEQLGRRVAVKFMTPQLCRNRDAVQRFLREARSASRITGEHVARVIDVSTDDDGTPYMVMEYLSGRDLAVELENRRLLPITEAVDYVLQACEALAEAHGHGIVHRDLKPSNLFLTQRADGSPLIKVLDFGISKAIADSEHADADVTEPLTESQHMLGSPHYMSPEQVRTPRMIDARSDIWALGVILYELISGQRPFRGETAMAILASVVSDPAPRLASVIRESPRDLGDAIQRCLSKDADGRFASVAELAQALSPFASPESRPLVGRIEGIVRTVALAGASSAPATRPSAQSSDPSPRDMLPATLESARDSPYGLESRTQNAGDAALKRSPTRLKASRVLWAVGLLTFGGAMYFVGARRSANDWPTSNAGGAAPSRNVLSAQAHATLPQGATATAAPVELSPGPAPRTAKSLESAAAPAAAPERASAKSGAALKAAARTESGGDSSNRTAAPPEAPAALAPVARAAAAAESAAPGNSKAFSTPPVEATAGTSSGVFDRRQ